MTEAIDRLDAPVRVPSATRLVASVSAAHFISHYYILILAPLIPFVRADYGLSYTQIGFILTTFNVVSTLLQPPAGFLIDRVGARLPLIGAVLIGALAFIAVGVTHSYWLLVAMFALAGVGNTIYHPANYALLSHGVPAGRMGQAYSIHSFSGMLGSAVTPPTLLLMQAHWGWRGAFIGAGIAGLVIAVALFAMPDARTSTQPAAKSENAPKQGLNLLFSFPILLQLVFFLLLSMMNAGIANYSVVALNALFGTPVKTGNFALTANLLLTALGVLAGGWLVGRTNRHVAVAALGLAITVAFVSLIGLVDLHATLLIAAMAVTGFFTGLIYPSRDLIVREATPPGSFGKVFGFVTTGFNLGGIVAPPLFGAVMDHGSPALVFILVAVFTVMAIGTVAWSPRKNATAS